MNLSSAGVIAKMIRDQIAAGVIPADIPGIAIERLGDELSISIDGSEETRFSLEGSRALADTIHGVIDGRQAPTIINMDHKFGVAKQGTGFKVMLPFGREEFSFPADLARDFADLIEKAAA
jgi:hypothetical protein